jgi:toxin ParE1/3/4
MKTVRILRRAQRDLEEIKRYIERDSPRRAEKFVSKLLDRIESLSTLPNAGILPRDATLRARGFLVLIERQYLIFYKVLSKQVRVYRVLHGRRRYQHLL